MLDTATANQISGIVVNALTTPLIDWSGTPNGNTSVLQQLKMNAEGLGLILNAVQAVQQAVQQGADPQVIATAVVSQVKALLANLPANDAAQVADLVIAQLGQRINTPPAPA